MGTGGFKFFTHFLVNQEFLFDPEIVEEVRNMLAHASNEYKSENKSIVFVSVHVRRTDYEEFMRNNYQGVLASKAYYVAAMNEMRKNRVNFK